MHDYEPECNLCLCVCQFANAVVDELGEDSAPGLAAGGRQHCVLSETAVYSTGVYSVYLLGHVSSQNHALNSCIRLYKEYILHFKMPK